MIALDSSPFKALDWVKSKQGCLLIAGPCSAESEEQTLSLAHRLKNLGVLYYRASLWKPRTQPGGFEGMGSRGLPWLKRVQEELGLHVMTEVANPRHIEEALAHGIQHLWIGARTSSSPFAMSEIAEAIRGCKDLSVLVKNPINPDINLWEGALLRLSQVGVGQIGAIHRGFSTYGEKYYRNTPIWQIPIELKLRHPELSIIVDPSHIGGKRLLIEGLCRSALEMNFDGLMIEVHATPDEALSDAAQQITPQRLNEILSVLDSPQACDQTIRSELGTWREQINSLDERLLDLLAQRQRIAEEIGCYKQKHNMCILHPERYRELMQTRQTQAESLGLNKDYIHDLFSRIHEESVRVQLDLQV